MRWQTMMTGGDLRRLHDIASVLVRFGFGDVVRRLGLAGALERAGKALHWRSAEELARLEPPARARRALEELGPTFVKLGQVLATRVDLLPDRWIAEFRKLQDAAPALPFEGIRGQLREDLGAEPEEIFAAFDTVALAAASVAQVHRAQLADGTPVVVKVRRPGIRDVVEADLRLLDRIVRIMEAEMPDARRYHPRDVMQQFTLSLRRELDLAAECRSAERVARSFAEHPEIVVPSIHWQWTGERVNVQDFVDGVPGRDVAAAQAAGLDCKLLARRGAMAVLKMVLEDGFFHADPHPGNVFYLSDDRVAFIDFGMVGRLSEERRFQVARLLHGLVTSDARAAADVLDDWSSAGGDSEALLSDVDAFIDRYRGLPLKQLDVGAVFSDLATLLRNHGLTLPPDLAMMFRVFITAESVGRGLDPEFDMAGEAEPFLTRVLIAHHAPSRVVRRGWRATLAGLDLLSALPQDVKRLLQAARQGRFQVHVDVPRLEEFGERLDRAASRLTVGVVTGALLIGSSIVMTVRGGATPLGAIGFIGATLGGIWLLASIWRSGRR